MKKSIYQVPYNVKGDLLHHASFGYSTIDTVIWKNNDIFECALTLDSFERGRSAAYYFFKNDNGCLFPMFLVDLEHLLFRTTIKNGRVENGVWSVKKRGQNYGVRFLTENER